MHRAVGKINQVQDYQRRQREVFQDHIADKDHSNQARSSQENSQFLAEGVQSNRSLKINASGERSNKETPQSDKKMSFGMAATIVTTIMVDEKKEEKTAAERGAMFEVHQKRLLLDKRTLFIFDHTFKIRKAVVWITEWKWFERFIILCIVVNSVCLAIADYKTRLAVENYQSNRERELAIVDNVLTAIFIAEFILKLISRGAFMHKTAYLKDPWNWLDFFVVVISILGLFKLGNKGLRALRTFRILRPLKTINAVPRIRAQINVLILSIPGLVNTLLFLTFIFLIFSILGSQSFAGGQYKQCRMTQEPLIVRDESKNLVSYSWPIVDTFNGLCRDDNSCQKMIQLYGPEDLQVYKCGQSIDYGVSAAGPIFYDGSDQNEEIYYDIVNFNNVGNGLVVIFQTLTLEGWTTLMYNYMDSQSYVTSIFFFITLTLLGSFFMLNLVLATIIESFYETKKKQVSEVLEVIQESKLTEQINTSNIAGQLNSEISEPAKSQSKMKLD